MRWWLFLCYCFRLVALDHAVTYEFSGGRFGDCLLSYLHAKWLSYVYQIPLLYKPFLYSTDLALHEREVKLTNGDYRLRYRASVANIAQDVESSQPFLFSCPYFPEDPIEREEEKYLCFDVDWKDPGFRKAALEMIAPKKQLRLVEPPQGTVNIAIHVRNGENYDDEALRRRFPLKLPPFSFYLEALPRVLEYFRDKSIYCHIFTDAEQPAWIEQALHRAVPPGMKVQFAYRKGVNRHNWNVLDDFFSLFRFDVLIRSQSNFSLIPSKLHDYAIVCFPSDFSFQDGNPIIEKTELEVEEELYQRLLLEKS